MAHAADASFLSRRGLVFLVIVGVHVFFFWALNSGLSHKVVQKVFGPLVTDIIEEAQQEEEELPPPPPKIETPPPYVPPPEIAIDVPAETAPVTAITSTTNTRPVEAPPPAAAPPKPVVVEPRSDPRRPLSQPEYPPTSRRLGEVGTVTLDILVSDNGRVTEAKVAKSSGFPRLDEAAVRHVTRSWRMIPGTENGKPAAMWRKINVTFKLTD